MSLFDEPVVVTTPVAIPPPEPITAEWLEACRGKRDRHGNYRWNLTVPSGSGEHGELVFDLREHMVYADGEDDYVNLMTCETQAAFVNLLWALGIPLHFKD